MGWLELHIKTTGDLATPLSLQLSEWGAQAVTIKDAGNQPLYEPGPDEPILWPETLVIGLFDDESLLQNTLQNLQKEVASGRITHLETHHLPDENWERRCLEDFKPMRFGNRLWICPSWHTPPDQKAVNVILDPGLAFGTGTHPTTTLCLEWLDQNLSKGASVIDYGTGSGILGIAALKLGAEKVYAVDHDGQALLATQMNCERNHIDFSRFFILPTEHSLPKVDLIVANILAKPLIALAPYFATLLNNNGRIILSGVLKEQENEIISAYNQWFMIKSSTYKEEWLLLEAIFKETLNNI